MKEEQVKQALEEIEWEPGAQERMYANILKKAAQQGGAAAQESSQAAPQAQGDTRRKKSGGKQLRQQWGAWAACLVLVAAVGLVMPHVLHNDGGEGGEGPTLAASPYEDVAGPEAFAAMGIVLSAPEGAEDATYSIYREEIACVDFTVDGHRYSCEAARLDGNFSSLDEEAADSRVLDEAHEAALDELPSGSWRAHWASGGVRYYVTNTDGGDGAAVTAVTAALIAQNDTD